MLILVRNLNESIVIDGIVKVTLIAILPHGRAKLGVDAPREITVHREEVAERIGESHVQKPVSMLAVSEKQKAERKMRANAESERQRAERLRDHVLKTWNPPLTGMGSPVDVAQTSVMQTLAFVFGKDFFPSLTHEQAAAIDGGMKVMREELGEE